MDTDNISLKYLIENLEMIPDSKSMLQIIKNITLTESENIAIVKTNKGNSAISIKNGKLYIDSLNRKLNID